MRVYVVGFAPADERATVGGFDWFYEVGDALDRAREHLPHVSTHSLAIVPVEVPDEVAYRQPGGGGADPDSQAITAYLDDRHELFEVSLPPAQVDRPTTQTRPSAILRRPDPETPISEATTAELLFEALERTKERRRLPLNREREQAGVLDLRRASDAMEDAISLHNRAVYRERGIFAITDAERTEP